MRPARLAPPPARALALAAAGAVILAYQVQFPVAVPAASALSALSYDGFYPGEGSYRWSRGRGRFVFHDPGPGVRGRVEVDLAGWRPRGHEPPRVVLEAAGVRAEARPSRQGETVTLPVVTGGAWRSDLVVSLESETFRPGPQDPRPLGARVQSARFVPDGPVLWPRRPPLGAPLVAAITVLLLAGTLLRLGSPPRRVRWVGIVLATGLGLAFALARPYAAWSSLPLLAVAVLFALVAGVRPVAVHAGAAAARASARAWLGAARAILPDAVIHAPAAQDIAGPDQDRETDLAGGEDGALQIAGGGVHHLVAGECRSEHQVERERKSVAIAGRARALARDPDSHNVSSDLHRIFRTRLCLRHCVCAHVRPGRNRGTADGPARR